MLKFLIILIIAIIIIKKISSKNTPEPRYNHNSHYNSGYKELSDCISFIKTRVIRPMEEYRLNENLEKQFRENYLDENVLKEIARDILRHCRYNTPMDVKIVYYQDGEKMQEVSNQKKSKNIAVVIYSEMTKPEEVLGTLILECINFYLHCRKIEPKETMKAWNLSNTVAVYMGFYDYLAKAYSINQTFSLEKLRYIHNKIYNSN